MENSILNKEASCFNTHSDMQPKPVNVLQFLTDRTALKLQDEIRSCVSEDDKKAIKAEAKCIAISGTFSKRGESGLIKHSGLIAIDIDLKDNKEILGHPEFFSSICALPWMAYFGRSISGSGYFGIIPIVNATKHKEHFAAIESVFKTMNIILDKAPSNVSSLRYQSYDENAYFNHQLYADLQLSHPFDDSVYLDIITGGKQLREMTDEKISELTPIIGLDQTKRIAAAKTAIASIMLKVQTQREILNNGYYKTSFKGRIFPLQSVINVGTVPEISPEGKQKALESFRYYILNEQEQETHQMLNDFAINHNKFIQDLKSKGYQNAGAGFNESCLSDFFEERDDSTLIVRQDAIGFLRGLSDN